MTAVGSWHPDARAVAPLAAVHDAVVRLDEPRSAGHTAAPPCWQRCGRRAFPGTRADGRGDATLLIWCRMKTPGYTAAMTVLPTELPEPVPGHALIRCGVAAQSAPIDSFNHNNCIFFALGGHDGWCSPRIKIGCGACCLRHQSGIPLVPWRLLRASKGGIAIWQAKLAEGRTNPVGGVLNGSMGSPAAGEGHRTQELPTREGRAGEHPGKPARHGGCDPVQRRRSGRRAFQPERVAGGRQAASEIRQAWRGWPRGPRNSCSIRHPRTSMTQFFELRPAMGGRQPG